MKAPPKLWTAAEVALHLACSQRHVYDVIARGELDVVDIGSGRRAKTRIPEDSLAKYIESRRRRAPRAGTTD
ncbi:MAG: hypothetical protein QOJ50_1565 [Cryptosporangiaceae bacterium]|jgi:excisionase family DNA binding protein|nr:hypothetical protein [Cryptosporangiaceae bacterium]